MNWKHSRHFSYFSPHVFCESQKASDARDKLIKEAFSEADFLSDAVFTKKLFLIFQQFS